MNDLRRPPGSESRPASHLVPAALGSSVLASLLAFVLIGAGFHPRWLAVALGLLAVGGPWLAWRALVTSRPGWRIGFGLVALGQVVLVVWSTPAGPVVPHRLLRLAVVLAAIAAATTLTLALTRPAARRRVLLLGLGLPAMLFMIDLCVPAPAVGPVPGRPEWRTALVSDPLVGERYLPDTGFTSSYPDDGGGDHDAIDFRERRWSLSTFEGNQARLELPADAPTEVRVAIAVADSGPTWHIQLNQSGLAVRELTGYSVRLRIRADSARTLGIGFLQAHEPWTPIGFYRSVNVDTAWRTVDEYFIAGIDDADTRLALDLGGSAINVTLADVLIEDERGLALEPSLPLDRWEVRYRINGAGCRGTDPATREPAAQRIIVLGDGDAMGLGVRERDTFARRLEVGRDAGTRPRTVLNCGQPGDATTHAAARYRALAAQYHPGAALLVLGPETLHRLHREATATALRRLPAALRLSSAVSHLFPARAGDRREASRHLADQVGELAKAVRSDGSRLVIAILRIDQDPEWSDVIDPLRDALREDGAAVLDLGVQLVDRRLGDRLSGSDPDRLSAAAHRIVAEALRPVLDTLVPSAGSVP